MGIPLVEALHDDVLLVLKATRVEEPKSAFAGVDTGAALAGRQGGGHERGLPAGARGHPHLERVRTTNRHGNHVATISATSTDCNGQSPQTSAPALRTRRPGSQSARRRWRARVEVIPGAWSTAGAGRGCRFS